LSNADLYVGTDVQRIAVVTGASGGMGRETAALLASKHGMKVYLLARNEEKGQLAVDYVNGQSGRNDAELVLCDLASLDSIRQAAAELAERCQRIDVLINNAGVITMKRQQTKEGFEQQLGVNHLGHFVLTGLLIPLLNRSQAGRIVIVSSGAHKIGRMNYDDPHMLKRFSVWGAYGRSKIANLWFMTELAKRLKNTSITVNALHPGAVATQIGVDRGTGFGTFVHKLLKPFFLTPEQGSATAVYLATSDEVFGASGQYYIKCKIAPMSDRASSVQEAERFWNWSEQVSGYVYP
jgi:retinol dehydrogenase 14